MPSLGSGSPSPSTALAPLSGISESTLTLARSVPAHDVVEEMRDEHEDREQRRVLRENRRAGHGKYRCFDCKRFVRGKWATCDPCGYRHGGMNHEAESVK